MRQFIFIATLLLLIPYGCAKNASYKSLNSNQEFQIVDPKREIFSYSKNGIYQGYFALLQKTNGIYSLKKLSRERVERTLPSEEILYINVKTSEICPAFERAKLYVDSHGLADYHSYFCQDRQLTLVRMNEARLRDMKYFDDESYLPYEACKSKFTHTKRSPLVAVSFLAGERSIDQNEIKLAVEQSKVIVQIFEDAKSNITDAVSKYNIK
jgi:hypothetical protein